MTVTDAPDAESAKLETTGTNSSASLQVKNIESESEKSFEQQQHRTIVSGATSIQCCAADISSLKSDVIPVTSPVSPDSIDAASAARRIGAQLQEENMLIQQQKERHTSPPAATAPTTSNTAVVHELPRPQVYSSPPTSPARTGKGVARPQMDLRIPPYNAACEMSTTHAMSNYSKRLQHESLQSLRTCKSLSPPASPASQPRNHITHEPARIYRSPAVTGTVELLSSKPRMHSTHAQAHAPAAVQANAAQTTAHPASVLPTTLRNEHAREYIPIINEDEGMVPAPPYIYNRNVNAPISPLDKPSLGVVGRRQSLTLKDAGRMPNKQQQPSAAHTAVNMPGMPRQRKYRLKKIPLSQRWKFWFLVCYVVQFALGLTAILTFEWLKFITISPDQTSGVYQTLGLTGSYTYIITNNEVKEDNRIWYSPLSLTSSWQISFFILAVTVLSCGLCVFGTILWLFKIKNGEEISRVPCFINMCLYVTAVLAFPFGWGNVPSEFAENGGFFRLPSKFFCGYSYGLLILGGVFGVFQWIINMVTPDENSRVVRVLNSKLRPRAPSLSNLQLRLPPSWRRNNSTSASNDSTIARVHNTATVIPITSTIPEEDEGDVAPEVLCPRRELSQIGQQSTTQSTMSLVLALKRQVPAPAPALAQAPAADLETSAPTHLTLQGSRDGGYSRDAVV